MSKRMVFWLCFHSHKAQQNPINERGPSCKFLLLAAERDLHCICTSVIWHQGSFPRLIWHGESLANSVFGEKKIGELFSLGHKTECAKQSFKQVASSSTESELQSQEEGSSQHLCNILPLNFWIAGGSACIWYEWGVMWFYATSRLGRWGGKHFV